MASGTNAKYPRQKNNNDQSLESLALEMGHKPPQAVDVEEAVIGAMLIEPNCVDDALGELTESCFYNPKLRMIFNAIRTLSDGHVSVDVLTVTQQLRNEGNLETVGGNVALAELSAKIGAAAHVEYYMQILKQKDIQRKLITASYDILKDSYDDSVNVDDLIQSAQGKVFDAIMDNMHNGAEHIGSVITDALADMNERKQAGSMYNGVRSGFKGLDEYTMGFQKSDLIILAARPSVGKTAFAMNVARNAAVDYNVPVAIFSLEMPSIQLALRMMVSETGFESNKLKSGNLEPYEWKELEMKIKSLTKAPIYIDSTPSLPVYEFRTKAKRLAAQKHVGLIVVDYLQLMQGPKELRGMREQEVAAISRTLKATAKELQIPIIALSQLSRNAVQRQASNNRPQLSDLRESGSIEQDADMVLFIHRADYGGLSDDPEDKGKTTLIIAKHRNGSVGDVPLVFRSSEVKFVDESDSLMNAPYAESVGSAMNSEYDAPFPQDSSDF